MFEKYGLLIALFILALCVNSNIITESRLLGILVDSISFTVMVSCVFAAWIIKTNNQDQIETFLLQNRK
ncbi:hypothetical protein [Bacillus sp. (in: firmicutes)]|uniref:hypothetical protein n=1 Tax=Bacillus sp. TaxID=1409 RepID=UPI0023F126A7|nr:hypothetical protein [Bacillus sp. (in: firmicutes)]